MPDYAMGKHEPSPKRKQQILDCLHQISQEMQTAVIQVTDSFHICKKEKIILKPLVRDASEAFTLQAFKSHEKVGLVFVRQK